MDSPFIFPPGPMLSTMTHRILLVDDKVPETPEMFEIVLKSSNDRIIVIQDALEVTVLDDDSKQS